MRMFKIILIILCLARVNCALRRIALLSVNRIYKTQVKTVVKNRERERERERESKGNTLLLHVQCAF